MSNRGQASTEYVAIVLVVAILLAAGSAVAVPAFGARLVGAVRTGICIVGGDFCRSSDAAAAGLGPCVTRASSTGRETAVEVAIFKLGERGEWQLAVHSDGSALVSRLTGSEGGVTAGVGLTFSPLGADAAIEASVVARYGSGRAWRFADARAATAFVERVRRDEDALPAALPRADVSWRALGGGADAWLGAAVMDLAHAGLEIGGSSALGMRTDGGRRTLALDLGVREPGFESDLPGFPGGGGKERALVAEVTWERGGLREIAIRSASSSGGRLLEMTGRLDLRDPGNRAAARRLLDPLTLERSGLRTVSERMATHGVVELSGYDVTEERRGFSGAAKLGAVLGLSHHEISSERRLTDAIAWIRGEPRRRFDCLGV